MLGPVVSILSGSSNSDRDGESSIELIIEMVLNEKHRQTLHNILILGSKMTNHDFNNKNMRYVLLFQSFKEETRIEKLAPVA